MRFIGNVLWVLLGGLILAVLWLVAGVLCCVTIIGIPLAIPCFKFAQLVLWPFGRTVEFGPSVFSFGLNILWIIICGWELAVVSLIIGVLWCVTIIGIPWGLQSFKFAQLALMPFGAQIVPVRKSGR